MTQPQKIQLPHTSPSWLLSHLLPSGSSLQVVNSVIMDHVTIGDGCSIQGSVICSNVQLQERVVLRDCQVSRFSSFTCLFSMIKILTIIILLVLLVLLLMKGSPGTTVKLSL